MVDVLCYTIRTMQRMGVVIGILVIMGTITWAFWPQKNVEEARIAEIGDRDNDGLFTDEEIFFLTNTLNPDTDGDHYLDGEEVRSGFDPKKPGVMFSQIPFITNVELAGTYVTNPPSKTLSLSEHGDAKTTINNEIISFTFKNNFNIIAFDNPPSQLMNGRYAIINRDESKKITLDVNENGARLRFFKK